MLQIVGLSVAWLVIVAAIIFTLMRLLTPLLGEYHHGFERMVSAAIGRPVRFARVEAHWQGLEPTFGFKRVDLFEPDGTDPLIQIHKLRIGIDLLASLYHQRFIPGKIVLSGMDLEIKQQHDGHIVIHGILDKSKKEAISAFFDTARFDDWVDSKPRLQLNHVNVKWHDPQGSIFQLNNLKLILESAKRDHYALRGQVMLSTYSPEPIYFALDVIGQLGNDKDWQVKGYVKGQAVSLKTLLDTQRLPYVKLTEGNSDLELWFHGAPYAWQLDSAVIRVQQPDMTLTLPQKTKRLHLFSTANDLKSELHLVCHWIEKTVACDVKGQELKLDYNDWFARAIALNRFSLGMQWQPQGDKATTLKIPKFSVHNKDLNVSGEMSVNMTTGQSPEVNLLAQYDVLPKAVIADYMPIHLLNPKVISWLRSAVTIHNKATGDLVLRGSLKSFPYDHQEGTFLARVEVKDVGLKYLKNWPNLSKLAGRLAIRGRQLEFEGNKGQCDNAQFKHFQATIPKLGTKEPLVLQVNGAVTGDLADGLRFIKESPLKNRLGHEALKHIELSGPMALNLDMTVPITKLEHGLRINGEVSTEAGEFKWSTPKIVFHRIRAKATFTQDAIHAKDMVAILWGEPVTAQIDTVETKQDKQRQMSVSVDGRLEAQHLAHEYGINVQTIVAGKTRYQALLTIPMFDKTRPVTLRATSNLYGMAINLMPVFKKTAVTTTPAELYLKVNKQAPFELYSKLGNVFATAVQFSSANNKVKLQRMNFKLGDSEFPALLEDTGLYVTGHLSSINDSLMRTIKQTFGEQVRRQPSPWKQFVKENLKAIVVQIEALDLFGQSLKNVGLQLVPLNDAWQVNVDSKTIKGDLTVPHAFPKQGTLKAKMQYITLTPGKFGVTVKSIKPQDVGNLDVVSYQTRYGDKTFGRLSFQTKVSPGLLEVQNIQAGDRGWSFHGSGDWRHSRNSESTKFLGHVSIHDTGKMLHDWDYPASVKGKGKINMNLTWPGAPYEMNRKQLSGQVKIAMDKGQLAHIDSTAQTKIGLGQLINLLSVANLQRVVELDFRGLFGKELNFDGITGTFNIANGDVRTKDTALRGPVMDVDIKGRIGLNAEDLSLKIGVAPHVTGSLPVVATVAGGPVIGAATWLVEKLANPLVKKVIRYEYQVTGTWEKPFAKPL